MLPILLPWEGYEDVIIHKALLEVLHDGLLGDLGEQDHVIHPTLLDIVALPVEALLAALQGEGHSDCGGNLKQAPLDGTKGYFSHCCTWA